MLISEKFVIYDPEIKQYVYYASTWMGNAIGIKYSKQPKASGIKESSGELLDKFHKVIDDHIAVLQEHKNRYGNAMRDVEILQRLKTEFQIHRLTTEVYTPNV